MNHASSLFDDRGCGYHCRGIHAGNYTQRTTRNAQAVSSSSDGIGRPWGEHPRRRMIFGGPLCYTTCMRFPKVRLNRQQRELYAQRITEVGNLAVAALLLGQVIAGEFRVDWTLWGVTIWVASYIVGGILLRQRGSKDE